MELDIIQSELLTTELLSHGIDDVFDKIDKRIHTCLVFTASTFIHCRDGEIYSRMIIAFIDMRLNRLFFRLDIHHV